MKKVNLLLAGIAFLGFVSCDGASKEETTTVDSTVAPVVEEPVAVDTTVVDSAAVDTAVVK